MNNRIILHFIVTVIISTCVWADELFQPDEIICVDDLNTNQQLDTGEMIRCSVTDADQDFHTTHDQDNICLHDMVSCDPRYLTPNCPTGSTLDKADDYCHAAVKKECPNGYGYDSAKEECVESSPASLPPNILPVTNVCPKDMVYSSDIDACSAFPDCHINGITGVYLPEGVGGSYRDMCFMGYYCPYSDSIPCKNYQGHLRCSNIPCVPYKDAWDDESKIKDGENDQTNDGKKAPDGSCLDNLYIFPGKDMRCRKTGITVGYQNCCTDTDYYTIIWINQQWLLWKQNCNTTEEHLIKLKTNGLCHYIGTYCSKRLKTFFGSICFERKKTYCCFNSKLARIVHEQGRPQLKTFSQDTWGEATAPLCTGFTPELFQNLDFSQIDLSEWYSDIVVESDQAIIQKMFSQIAPAASKSGP